MENFGITSRLRRRIAGSPETRVPAIIVSPFAKKGVVDHTQYDTTSILRLIARRFGLPSLPGVAARDAHGNPPMGDLTNALDLTHQ
jgi:phospholipase C